MREKTLNRLNAGLAIVLLIAVTAAVYANSLKNNFVWDDYLVITDNSFVKSWKNFPAIFSSSYLTPLKSIGSGVTIGSGETTYRPVVTISYFLEYWLWKLNPFWYHFSNILLHIVNAILLYLFVYLLVKNRQIAILSSLIFALHPINAEAVNVISFREDLLAFLFFVSSLILFIRHDSSSGIKKNLCSLFSVIFFILALFSKENTVMLPAVLFLYDYFFNFKRDWRTLSRRAVSRYSPYILAVIFYMIIWFTLKKGVADLIKEYPYPGGSIYTNFLTMSRVIGIYILWLILPVNIHATLPENNPELTLYSIFKPEAFLSVALITLLLLLAFAMRKTAKEISFAIFWFFVMLLPVSNIMPISCIMASRYLYIPMAGFCIIVSAVLFSSGLSRRFARNTAILLVIFYSVLTPVRNLSWRNNLVIWKELADYYPGNPEAHTNFATQLEKIGLLDQAVSEYKAAIRLDPGLKKVCISLGVDLGKMGRYEESVRYLKKAISIDAKYAEAYNNLAVTYANMKNWDAARAAWAEALKINPSYGEAAHNLEKLNQLTK